MSTTNWGTADLKTLNKKTINGLNLNAVQKIGARIDEVPNSVKGDLEARRTILASSSNKPSSGNLKIQPPPAKVNASVANKKGVSVTVNEIGEAQTVLQDAYKGAYGKAKVYVAVAKGGRRTRRGKSKRARHSRRR
jgi:hypothetical protein